MNIWNKVLLVLIFLTALVYVVLVSNRFNLAKEWEEKLVKQDREIQNLSDEVAKLKVDLYGQPLKEVETWDDMGLIARMNKIHSLIPGKIWTDCLPSNVSGMDGGVIKVDFTIPPTGIVRQYGDMKLGTDTLIFAFDSGLPYVSESGNGGTENDSAAEPQKGQFLGFFTVDQINAETGEFNIQSIGTVIDDQKRWIQESLDAGRSWIIYEDRLPVDSPNDLAYWLAKEPDGPFAKTLSEEDKAYFSRKSLRFPSLNLDELNLESAVQSGQVVPETLVVQLQNVTLPENERLSDNYDAVLLRHYYQMDDLNVMIARATKSIDNLNHVIANQLAMIGLDAVPAEVIDQIGQEAGDLLAAILPQAKGSFNAETFIQKKENAAAQLAEMESQRDLVKTRLDLTSDCVIKIGERLNYLVKENARLAQEIAKALFEASDKIIQRSENVTAQINPDSVMNMNPLRFED